MKAFRITDGSDMSIVVGEDEKAVKEWHSNNVEIDIDEEGLEFEEVNMGSAFFWKSERGYEYTSVSERIKEFNQFPCVVGSNFE
ncbi:hypothetical protein CON51_24265 [Bacillus thuringiensis]|uniref:hypothetical protein n=1 Tax=Bacillus thuringiensis TaxID=1428 RepID=UPI000BEDC107|nr:hypothetical protein [Bacillus thuringiensis]PEF84905.1 hypothetical protein CON51_24265 [Bacillus thuringiensis]